MNIDALSIRSQPPPQNIVPLGHSGDISLNTLLRDTGRTKNNTPGDEHNNCGFNAILEQVGDRSSNSGMVNLLRSSLGYADENSGTTLNANSFSDVASLFRRPVVVVWSNNRNQVTEVSFYVLSSRVGFSVHGFIFQEYQFSQNFVQFRRMVSVKNIEAQPLVEEEINDLSQYVAGLNEATVFDVIVQLLQSPETIALISREGSHSDAAPHKDLQQENNVLEFLRRAADRRRAAN